MVEAETRQIKDQRKLVGWWDKNVSARLVARNGNSPATVSAWVLRALADEAQDKPPELGKMMREEYIAALKADPPSAPSSRAGPDSSSSRA
jgi:hypothetical protein